MKLNGRLVVELLPDGRNALVLEDCEIVDDNGRAWPISKGLVSDGGSLPPASWSPLGLSPFTGACRAGFFAHDQAYQTPGVNKDQADLMLRDYCAETIEHWKAEAIYAGVRRWGASSYAEDQFDAAAALLKTP